MRDLVVREALTTMAREAAVRFRELIASGEEIPYDVREAGQASPLCQYAPLTERFIREHAPLLRGIDAFGAACAAIESADLAERYLKSFEIPVPPDGRRRAELAGVVFLCRLWRESSDFSLEDDRLDTAIGELEARGEPEDEVEVVVPVRGLRMDADRLELATAILVRSDTVEVPAEARTSGGSAAAAWEPTFIAATRCGRGDRATDNEVGANAVDAFRDLTTTLRLFKAGGVALGPHAWIRAAGDRWRRVATGAGQARPGGYRLAETEIEELSAFSRALASRSTPLREATGQLPGRAGALARAVSRFEAGLERSAVLEALNDYLLALRFLLEGGGPADMGLAMRVAALCAEPEGRADLKGLIDRAAALERELWSGEPAATGEATPAELAAEVEDVTRAILRDAVCGRLGTDLRATADEILLADGLAVGEGEAEQRGATEEWNLPEAIDLGLGENGAEVASEDVEAAPQDVEVASEDPGEMPEPGEGVPERGYRQPARFRAEPEQEPETVEEQLWLDGVTERTVEDPREGPSVRRRISVQPEPEPQEEQVSAQLSSRVATIDRTAPRARGAVRERRTERSIPERRTEEREAIANRVAYLFPRPETTEWSVRELDYDRRRRARVPEFRAS